MTEYSSKKREMSMEEKEETKGREKTEKIEEQEDNQT
jgi:hypothetical protein